MNLLRFLLLICMMQTFSVMAQSNQVLSKTERQFCARFSGEEKEMCDQSNYPPCNTVNTSKCFGVLQYQGGSKYVGERNGNFRFGNDCRSNKAHCLDRIFARVVFDVFIYFFNTLDC